MDNNNIIKKQNNNNLNSSNEINDINKIIGNVNCNINNLDSKLNAINNYKKVDEFNEKIYNSNNAHNCLNINKMDIDFDNNTDNKKILNNNYKNDVLYDQNELTIINEVNKIHIDLKKIINNRKNTLKRLSKFCVEKDVPSTINYLNMINELAIYNDFLNYALLQSDTVRVPLTMDNTTFLLNHVLDLLKSKYDNYKKTGIKSATVMLKLFGERIISIKGSTSHGIDLTKEDRLKKCNSIIDIYKTINNLNLLNSIDEVNNKEV